MAQEVGKLVRFHSERFFEGAVQLRWTTEKIDQANAAAQSFVFHGPDYHGAGRAEEEGIAVDYRLKDSASFVADLACSLAGGQDGRTDNPFWLVVAGYGYGKSHLALTTATTLGSPASDVAEVVRANLETAHKASGERLADALERLQKPALVLALDGMAGFHLGSALSRAVSAQLQFHGVDDGAVRALSPRFQFAEQFTERNFSARKTDFEARLPGYDLARIQSTLRGHDEDVYSAVDSIYIDANGSAIPVTGQEDAQDLLNTLSEVYCGENGFFSSVVILFDEFGRYLEYAAEKPRLAGDAVLQQIFQGVQDNATKIRFVGFIQYELKAYLKRFGSADLRQLQRYITRFDSAQKWYLSTNLETLFAHIIGKESGRLSPLFEQTHAVTSWITSWNRLKGSLPAFGRHPVWSDEPRFVKVIGEGCWPLHPLSTWFLARQTDIVQSRSALTFIKEAIERVSSLPAERDGMLYQIPVTDFVLGGMLPEMIAAEREAGTAVAETLQTLLAKFDSHLETHQRAVLAGVAVLDKLRVGRHEREHVDALLQEATGLSAERVAHAVRVLRDDLGAVEWNQDLGQYELITDGATRGQFVQWLRKRSGSLEADAIRDLFVRRAGADTDLQNISSDFGLTRNISTPDWFFEAQFAHSGSIEQAVARAFKEWREASLHTDAKGKVIFYYAHPDDEIDDAHINQLLNKQLKLAGVAKAPVWIVGLEDRRGQLGEHLAQLYIFNEKVPAAEGEKYRRFIAEERQRSVDGLITMVQTLVKERRYFVAGFSEVPEGRMKKVADAIFENVYSKALPFPFDGFASTNGGGPADCAALTRNLIAREVDGGWVRLQSKRLQNRVTSLLAANWGVFDKSGELTTPSQPDVKTVFDHLVNAHMADPSRNLQISLQEVMSPPFGMNVLSGGLLLGLMLSLSHPPRRIEMGGNLIASKDWLEEAFSSQRGRTSLDPAVLARSSIRFLSEDSAGRWRQLFDRWDEEPDYRVKINIGSEVEAMRESEPLPEHLEPLYTMLRQRNDEAISALQDAHGKLSSYEKDVERAQRSGKVGEFLRIGSLVLSNKQMFEKNQCWPHDLIKECDGLLEVIRELIADGVDNWINGQHCNSSAQLPEYRGRMTKAVESLQALGFPAAAKKLTLLSNENIVTVEKRQKFTLTLDQSDDYPRTPAPTDSTPMRELRDDIATGDRLIEAVHEAAGVLSESEVAQRIAAIRGRQSKLKEAQQKHEQALSAIYSMSMKTISEVKETSHSIERLKVIFAGTRDASDVADMAHQVDRIIADVNTWPQVGTPPERIKEILDQTVVQQVERFVAALEADERDPAWDVQSVYRSLEQELLSAAARQSASWIAGRLLTQSAIADLGRRGCQERLKELSTPPEFLSTEDWEKLAPVVETLQARTAFLLEEERAQAFARWKQEIEAVSAVDRLEKIAVERLLRRVEEEAAPVTPAEQEWVSAVLSHLTQKLDSLSIEDIVARIERLPAAARQALMKRLVSVATEANA